MKNWARAFVMVTFPILLVPSTPDVFPEQQGEVQAKVNLEQVEHFLRTADVVGMENLPPGNTGPQKVTLAQGEAVHHAVFRRACFLPGLGDSWMLEIAAYEVDKLLGLNMVPPTVERTVQGNKGSLQLWIENAISEEERLEKKLDPPDVETWRRQIWKVRVFDQLVCNIDRNPANLLIDKNWKVYMIGHDRTFKATPDLMDPRILTQLPVSMVEVLKKLSKANLKRSCSGYLSDAEIDALLARRDKILEVRRQVAAVRTHIGNLPLKVNSD